LSLTVAFQGVHGAYSEQAVRQHFGEDVITKPYPNFSELLDAIAHRKVDFSVLPVENALAGAVNQAYELLLDHDLRIQAEIILHVHHCLLAPKGTTFDQIQIVRSHPQALAQCETYLRRHKFQPIPDYDTAGSAKNLAENPTPNTASIASRLAGELYGLDVLETDIEDVSFNYTRFFVLGHDDPPRGEYNKTSIVFAVRNRPAALYECLGEFAERGLNLTKLESRPRKNRPWEPIFYLDFEGHWQDTPCQEVLARLLHRTSFIKMLGSYPAVVTKSVGI